MPQKSDNSGKDTHKWRDKYLDLIEQHEQYEKSSERKQDQMRRALVVVSLLAEGQSDSIDRPLATLRDAIKPQNEGLGLESSVHVLQAEVNQFEQQWQSRADEILISLQNASKHLLRLPCSNDEKRRIKEIVSKSKEHLKQWSGYSKQLKAWSELLSDLTINKNSGIIPKDHHGGFLSRLFQNTTAISSESSSPSRQDKSDLDSSIETVTLTSQETPLEILAPKVGLVLGDEEKLGYDHIEQEISAMLTKLLAQLVIPERYNDQLEDLKKKLISKLNGYELIPLLEKVTHLVIDALGDGQEEFEYFLQGLDQRLETIQQLINDASLGQVNSSDARLVFEGLLEGQVDRIRSFVNSENDLGELGLSISEHLGLIIQTMHTFSSEESHRETELTEQLRHMQLKLDEMEKLAESAQYAIEEQRKKAMYDALTGLPNRDAYQQRLEQEVQRVKRYGGKLSLMVCDVDLFKRINDAYGHLAGDKVLKIIAKSLQRNLRSTDFIARFGGEEFVALMPETSTNEAKKVAEKMRRKIEESPFNFKKEPVQITVSFGISEFAEGETADEVFSRADKALYEAKNKGRNRIQLG
ncbi:MAG: diguanylate cyclase [Oleispira sp.]|jgi:diguanylate cyclase